MKVIYRLIITLLTSSSPCWPRHHPTDLVMSLPAGDPPAALHPELRQPHHLQHHVEQLPAQSAQCLSHVLSLPVALLASHASPVVRLRHGPKELQRQHLPDLLKVLASCRQRRPRVRKRVVYWLLSMLSTNYDFVSTNPCMTFRHNLHVFPNCLSRPYTDVVLFD